MMRMASTLFLVSVALAETGALPDRGAYQAAYRGWRAADPDLERDTASATPAMGARADKVAAEAAKYHAARKLYLDGLAADASEKAAYIEAFPPPLEIDGRPAAYVLTQTRLVSGSIDSIANDPDRAIQRLRVALDRERTALVALSSALADTQRGYDGAKGAAIAAEQSRGKLTQHYQSLSASLKETATQTEQSGALWADYYRALSDGLRGVISKAPAPPETAPALAVASAEPRVALPANLPPSPAPEAAVNPVPPPAPALRTRSITPLPLSRYTGAWIYPMVAAEFHGPEPSTVDMLLRETNGQAKGTLVVWFKVAANSKIEPAVRFDFEGPFQSSRNQSFPLITSNGAMGTVELIPGNVYNMIQVRFSTEDKPSTVRQADFLLIKK
jgi:hypothetical protein